MKVTTGTILVENINSTTEPVRFWKITRTANRMTHLQEIPATTWQHEPLKTPDLLTKTTKATKIQGYLHDDCVTFGNARGAATPWNGTPIYDLATPTP